MNRRGFIQISSVALLPILLGLFPKGRQAKKYAINVVSNRSFGHLLRTTAHTRPSVQSETDYIIVGGGIAGVSAAVGLKDEKFMLFEGGDRLGGSSASGAWKSAEFAMGAHYELAYPAHFGSEVIALLSELNVIVYNPETELHEFVDNQYVIKAEDIEQCFEKDEIYEDVLSEVDGIDEFYKALAPYENEMTLPTRLISEKHHYLNEISFKTFLASHFKLNESLEQRISYQMLDDWGGQCDEVSALAGIHYYTCRPYNTKNVALFSPPNGNAYFLEKMIGQLPNPESLRTNSLVRTVRETPNGVEAEIVNTAGEVELVKAKGLIYAGQKHALKYVLDSKKELFSNTYAPWAVINIVCRKGVDFEKWQNDVLTPDLQFLGFVNSGKQHSRSLDYDVFTAYYCFNSADRKKLIEIENNPDTFIQAVVHLIEESTETNLENYIEHVNLNLMGHAMPVPLPGYLSLKDVPKYSDNIVFAGVDTGRLPLFYEACDSGLQAANYLLNPNKSIDL